MYPVDTVVVNVLRRIHVSLKNIKRLHEDAAVDNAISNNY